MGKHSEWRKLAKKTRRTKLRQTLAQHRDNIADAERKRKENSPTHQLQLAVQAENECLQVVKAAEIAKERELEWQRVEHEAQKQFRLLQEKLAAAREERAKQNEQIKLEWEKEQQKKMELEEIQQKKLDEELKQQELLNQAVNDFVTDGGDTPEHLKTLSETNPNKDICPFFQKTSTCRFFDVCSRNHIRPGISRIILIPNFFTHYSLEKTENEHMTDSSLEFETYETYDYYSDFFYDVIPELEKHGKIKLFKTCCNHEAHLRGNVFVEFASTRSALISYRALNGRWYGGKQLSVEFSNIPSWKNAICGLHFRNRCPKGNACNFLHVFKNPKNLYDMYEDNVKRSIHQNYFDSPASSRNWRWSESPERLPAVSEAKKSNHRGSRSRSKNRHRSRSPSRKHKRKRLHSRSPSRKKRKRSKSLSRRSVKV